MRVYASGEIEFNTSVNNLETVIGKMDSYGTGFSLDYEEYFDDEIEELIEQLITFSEEYDVFMEGSIVIHSTGDGDVGEYVFHGNTVEEFWNDTYRLKEMDDDALIQELEKRGYFIIK